MSWARLCPCFGPSARLVKIRRGGPPSRLSSSRPSDDHRGMRLVNYATSSNATRSSEWPSRKAYCRQGCGLFLAASDRSVAVSSPTSHSLEVPGAQLYYEVQGSGPVFMLVGHPMGVSGFAEIAPLLAGDFTVVTYDPRGFARSSIENPDQDAEPDLLADDARRVLDAVGGEPAYVFGSSGGAVTGLA